MNFGSFYSSPFGDMLLLANEDAILGSYFIHQKGYPGNICFCEMEVNPISEAKKWLDTYYSGINPNYSLNYMLNGTPFQCCVWESLMRIPFGEVLTYGELARKIAESRGQIVLSAQAVGHAVGANPISVFIPCHRVIGTNGQLTGYAGGLERKISLLELEGNTVTKNIKDLRHSKLMLK